MEDRLQWIKLQTNIFDNRKIQHIETMPDADTILVVWFKLLALAGTINDDGNIYLTREIPYTALSLAQLFRRPVNTVTLALQLFEKLGMIEIVADFMRLSNWEKYQNTDAIAAAREKTRKRVAAFRERQRLAQIEAKNGCNVTETLRNALEEDKEKDKEEEKEQNKNESEREARTASHTREKEPRHRFGEYKNVLLTESQLEKLKTEFPDDYQERIENLSFYKQRTGKSYKDDLAAIRSWARNDEKKAGGPADLEKKNNVLQRWAAEERK